MIIADQPLTHAEEAPKQCKLLGATVRGLGLVTAVSSTLFCCYAMIEGQDEVRRLVRLAELKKADVTFPAEPQAYETRTERIGYGTWDEVYGLVDAQPVALVLAA